MLKEQDIGRITLKVLFIGGMLLASTLILWPFLPAILWAATLVLATWPLMLRVQHALWGRRSLAVLVMTLMILLVFIAPLWLAIGTIATNVDVLADLIRSVLTMELPSVPGWLAQIPLVGGKLAEAWEKHRLFSMQELAPLLLPYAGTVTQWVAAVAGSVGVTFVQFLVTTILAAFLYAYGERAASRMMLFGWRLAEERGEKAVLLAGQAIRSVALGVVVTALAQSLIGGIGLLVSGIPAAGLLTAVMFVLCLIQLGPGFVLVPAVVWLYYSGEFAWGTVLLLFSIVAMTIDQLLRPILIRKGANLPLLLILGGVLGGLIAFGLLGIFIGPTVLAVAYTILNAWMDEAAGRNAAGLPGGPADSRSAPHADREPVRAP